MLDVTSSFGRQHIYGRTIFSLIDHGSDINDTYCSLVSQAYKYMPTHVYKCTHKIPTGSAQTAFDVLGAIDQRLPKTQSDTLYYPLHVKQLTITIYHSLRHLYSLLKHGSLFLLLEVISHFKVVQVIAWGNLMPLHGPNSCVSVCCVIVCQSCSKLLSLTAPNIFVSVQYAVQVALS